MLKYILLISISMLGCSSLNRTEEPESSEPNQSLQEVYNANLRAYSFGFPSDCDAALWAGVAYCGGVDVALGGYLYPGDKPQRRVEETCYPTDANGDGRPDSRSTISNDGIIGLSMCDEEVGTRILSYAKANGGQMGEPSSALGEVYLKPNVQIVLSSSDTPTIYGKPKEDYQYHIQVLLILWEGRTYGAISPNALERLEGAVEAYPNDYLFQAALGLYRGNMETATKLLMQGINPSSYVRGDDRYAMANWLMAAAIVLNHGRVRE